MSWLCRDVSSWQIYSICNTEFPLVPCVCVNLFPYRPFIGAIYHEAFNDNHQWCCHPNPFRSLLYCPRQFDEAIVIMSPSACVRACVCLTQHYHSVAGAWLFHPVVCLFMHVCVCICVCLSCTELFAQVQTQHSSLLIHRPISPDKSTQSC